MTPIMRQILLSGNKKYIGIRHTAGTFNFGITNGTDVLWVFPDGTTSTAAQPSVAVPAGVTKLYASNLSASGVQLIDGSSNAIVTSQLKDFNKLTYFLSLNHCVNVTGSLADLQGKLTYILNLYNCVKVTGVYTPVGAGTPGTINLSNTGLSSADMDNTLIAIAGAETPKSNGTFTATDMTRTAASDAAVATLGTRGWTISGITKV